MVGQMAFAGEWAGDERKMARAVGGCEAGGGGRERGREGGESE